MSSTEGEDYIRCKVCGEPLEMLGGHPRQEHGMSTDEYEEYCKENGYKIEKTSRKFAEKVQKKPGKKLKEEVQRVSNKLDNFMTVDKFDEESDISHKTLFNRFNTATWGEILEECGVKHQEFKKIAKNFEEEYGWIKAKDVSQVAGTDQRWLYRYYDALEKAFEDLGMYVRRSSTGGHGGSKLFVRPKEMTEEALFKGIDKEVPEKYRDAFKELVGQGRSPSSAAAAINWITTKNTQDEVAEYFDVTPVTIRNASEKAKDFIPEEEYEVHEGSRIA